MVRFGIRKREIELLEYTEDASLNELVEELEKFRLAGNLKTKKCRGCGKCCSDDIPVLGLDIYALLKGLGIVGEYGQKVDIVHDSVCKDNQECRYSPEHESFFCPGYDKLAALGRHFILPGKPDLEFRRKAIGEMVRATGLSRLEASVIYEYNNAEPIIIAKQPDGACRFLNDGLCSKYDIRPYSCGLYLCNMGERLSYIQEMVIRQGIWHAYHLLGWVPEDEIAHNPFLKARSYGDLPVKGFEFALQDAINHLFFYY